LANTDTKYSTKKKPGKTKAFFICLIIASFLWLVHSLNTVYTHTFKIPVSFKNLPQNKRPVVQLPEILTVDVKASGLKLAFMLLNKSNRELQVDFNSLKAVNRGLNYVLSSSNIDLKRVLGFESHAKHVSPDTLYFSEKTGFQKNVALKVPVNIECRQGYSYKRPEINPAFITIYGDTADIEAVDTVYTQPIHLPDLYENISLKPAIIKPRPGIYTNINEASLFIEVEKLVEQIITIPVSDIHANNEHRRVNIFPSQVKVKFTVMQNAFNNQDTALFKAVIDSEKINRVTKKCEVFLNMVPGNATVMEITPKEVEILILKH
jgi:hypothetical protein